MSQRSEQLEKLLEKEPNDPFLIYGLAMEHKNARHFDRAVELLKRVVTIDPGYCYAYLQMGLAYESAGDSDAARRAYTDGIAAAAAKGDEHARQEIASALDLLG